MRFVTLVIALAVVAAPIAVSADASPQAAIDKPAPDFTLKGADGKERTLSEFKGQFVVLEWNNWDCPFVKKHYGSGNMQRLQKTYAEKNVVWLTICSSAPGKQGHYSAGEHRQLIESSGSAATAYLIDAEGTVGKSYGAKTTPHMFVIDPKGVLIYAGGIDDKKSTSPADIEGATNYVRECLDAAMAGKPVATRTSAPYGCSVKYKE